MTGFKSFSLSQILSSLIQCDFLKFFPYLLWLVFVDLYWIHGFIDFIRFYLNFSLILKYLLLVSLLSSISLGTLIFKFIRLFEDVPLFTEALILNLIFSLHFILNVSLATSSSSLFFSSAISKLLFNYYRTFFISDIVLFIYGCFILIFKYVSCLYLPIWTHEIQL